MSNNRIRAEKGANNRYSLVIERLRSDDQGRYMCYAVNSLGTHQKSVDLSTDGDELLEYDVEILSQANEFKSR